MVWSIANSYLASLQGSKQTGHHIAAKRQNVNHPFGKQTSTNLSETRRTLSAVKSTPCNGLTPTRRICTSLSIPRVFPDITTVFGKWIAVFVQEQASPYEVLIHQGDGICERERDLRSHFPCRAKNVSASMLRSSYYLQKFRSRFVHYFRRTTNVGFTFYVY